MANKGLLNTLLAFFTRLFSGKKDAPESKSEEETSKSKRSGNLDKHAPPMEKKHSGISASAIVKGAYKHLNTVYKYGGTSPEEGFDCSGLVYFVFEKEGYIMPRVSRDQAKEGAEVARKKIKEGDLVYFGESSNKIDHIGIVISAPGEPISMIHSSSSKGVILTNVDESDYWKARLQGIRRVI